jgi:hypothetical protein
MQRMWPSALIVALGFALGGLFIGSGFQKSRAADRFVTVRGVSEREAAADLALWPIRFVVADADLARAQARITDSASKVRAFLTKHGLDGAGAEVHQFNVVDTQANQYVSRETSARFIIEQTIMVRSDQPDLVFAANQNVGELVNAGIVLTAQGGEGGPTYLFTKLNDIKPPMIAEATASAREGGEQFANDSGSALGGIRRATQGYFTILPRDQAPGIQEAQQRHKTVRVVTTVEYFLK